MSAPPAELDAVVGLGSSLGPRRRFVELGVAALAAHPLCRLVGVSRLYTSPPVGAARCLFQNAAIRVRWRGDAPSLLAACLAVEARALRRRGVRFGDRTLDMDLLWSPGIVLDLPGPPAVILPHPRLTRRRFALLPLLDVAPRAVDPRDGRPLRDSLAAAAGPAAAVGALRRPQRRLPIASPPKPERAP